MDDRHWMDRAIALARRGEGKTRPNPPVGAVIVRDGVSVGEGYHHRAGKPHAEILALRAAGARARGATLYVTLEPCSTRGRTGPCTDAILAAGIARVVVGTFDPNPAHGGRGIRRLRRAGVTVARYRTPAACTALLRPFACWVRQGRPYVTVKLALSLDGRIADARGHSQWISGPPARRRVQDMRRRADAVLVGVRTVIRDDPSLLCRARGGNEALRVIADPDGELPLSSRVLTDGETHRTVVATTRRCPGRRRAAFEARGARVEILRRAGEGVSVRDLLNRLGRMELLHVLCEGGGLLAGALARAKLADEYALFMAPLFLGDRALPSLRGVYWPLARAPRLEVIEWERVGEDVFIRARPVRICSPD